MNTKKKILLLACAGMMLTAVSPMQAQDDTLLVSTSGPSVLGKNELLWSNRMEYFDYQAFFSSPYGHETIHGIGLGSNLRLGIGMRSELTLDLNSVTYIGKMYDSSAVSHLGTNFVPAVGARVMLYEGRGWLPQVAFRTELSLMSWTGTDLWFLQPQVGLQFRNRMGRHWLLDSSIGYAWNGLPDYGHNPFSPALPYSIAARWLPSSRLMLGIGVENGSEWLEAAWQASPDLMMSFRGSIRHKRIVPFFESLCDVQLGLQWLLR